jgi:hypothetical protein
MKRLDLRGRVFPYFSILQELDARVEPTTKPEKFRRHRMYLCLCKCGEKFTAKQESIVSGRKQSCGCIHRRKLKKAVTTHGMSKTFVYEYRAWCMMRTRYPLQVCEAWNRFDVFLKDMGARPKDGRFTRIDRIKPFGPDNCVWHVQGSDQSGMIPAAYPDAMGNEF